MLRSAVCREGTGVPNLKQTALREHRESRVARVCVATNDLRTCSSSSNTTQSPEFPEVHKTTYCRASRLQMRVCPVAPAPLQMRQQPKTSVQDVERRKQLENTSSSFPSPTTKRRISTLHTGDQKAPTWLKDFCIC